MYKVLALDLDGTVLNRAHRIQPKVKEAILEAKKHWHVVIATGRHHTTAKPYHHELGLNTPIICCNGTYTYDYQKNAVLHHNALKKQAALDFFALTAKHKMNIVLYVTEAMLYSKVRPVSYMQELEDWASSLPADLHPRMRQIDSFENEIKVAEHVWKFVVEAEADKMSELLVEPLVERDFSGERSWINRIDFSAKGNTKGAALAQYLADQGISTDEVIAVGDNHNDISMLKLAGVGVAMNNADEIVKASANEICSTDSNQDGLARVILGKLKG